MPDSEPEEHRRAITAPSTPDYLSPIECAIECLGLSDDAPRILASARADRQLSDWPAVREKLAEVRHAIRSGALPAKSPSPAPVHHDHRSMIYKAMTGAPVVAEPKVNRHDLRAWLRQSVPYEAVAYERDMLARRVAELETALATAKEERDGLARRLKPARPVDSRKEATYLHAIGALLSLLTGSSASGKPNSEFRSREAIKAAILDRFPRARGLKPRTLDDLFKRARASLDVDPD